MGNHRYQIGFSGDTVSVWDSLAFQPWFTATAANVGYAYWSHDIGGHMPGAVEPELFTRWVQFGAFSPILRTHTTKNPESERRIWAYPEPYSSMLRATFQLRYAMQPYIYTEARRTYDTGVAFLRPLYYDWPEEAAAYDSKDEYLFGDEMLVAPVVAPADKMSGLATEKVWLPAGRMDRVADGQAFHWPANGRTQLLIDQTPVYVKAGSDCSHAAADALHGRKASRSADRECVAADATARARATRSMRTRACRCDISTACSRGRRSRRPRRGDTLRVEIGPVEGGYPGMRKARGFEVRLPADWPPASVTVNGVAVKQRGTNGQRRMVASKATR